MSRKGERRTTFDVEVNATIDIDELVDSIGRDELVEFIIAIDAAAQEWDITLKLCDHFDKLRKEYEREESEDAAKRDAKS